MSRTLLFLLYLLSCNGQEPAPSTQPGVQNCSTLKPGDPGFLQLAGENEPGDPLIIYGKIFDKNSKTPISGASLFLYHTDTAGLYNPVDKSDIARIKGTLTANASGCFKISTILPGDYPNSTGTRHVHYKVKAEGFHEINDGVFFFRGSANADILHREPENVLEVKKDDAGVWTVVLNIFIDKKG